MPSMVAEEIQRIRTRLGATQEQFAKLVGVSLHTLSSWENGRRMCKGPSARFIQSVEMLLDDPHDWPLLRRLVEAVGLKLATKVEMDVSDDASGSRM